MTPSDTDAGTGPTPPTDTRPEHFDAIVIGTGQAGKPLADALADAGLRTAIVEREERVGGTCVVRGCTPTKTMIASARVAHLARRGEGYGVETGKVDVNLRTIRQRKREIVDSWSGSLREGMEERDHLELVLGEARFVGHREIQVRLRDGGTRRLAADRVFINTGARPAVPPLEGLERVAWLDSTTVMELAEVPEHLVVLGGGFVGLEFAQMFRRFGAQVTILERGSRLASREDEDVARALTEILEEDGIRIRTEVEARAVEAMGSGGVRVVLDSEGSDDFDGEEGDDGSSVTGSHLLVAAGRTPNTDSLNLIATGLEADDSGSIPVNGRRETAVEGIWALGDVTGQPPFTHVSYDDFRIVRENVLNGGNATAQGRTLTYVVFTDPQLGRVGWTEARARDRGRDVRVASLPMARVARAMETDETRGMMKAVVDAETDRILGAAILGVQGGEVMSVIKTAMMADLPWQELRDAVYAHPTFTESLNNLFQTLED